MTREREGEGEGERPRLHLVSSHLRQEHRSCLAWLMGKKIQLRRRARDATAITFSDHERARRAETRDRRSFGALSMRGRP